MTMAELIAAAEQRLAGAVAARKAKQDALVALRSSVESGDSTITVEQIQAAVSERDAADTALDARKSELDNLRAEAARDDEVAKLQSRSTSTGAGRPAYDEVARVGAEERTYRQDMDRRGRGQNFLTDVVSQFRGDFDALDRLRRHMQEERVERGADVLKRATGTSNFTGWVIPQYLVELNAPAAVAGRQFANICNRHDLPATGMAAYLSKITTGSSVADQSAQGDTVSETDMDDTQITVSIRTAAGSQSISRQAIERGTGVDEITFGDLLKRYNKNLDTNLLTATTHGLTNVATSVAYTDASPTAQEFYPKIQAAASGAEGIFLDMVTGLICVMSPRRWRWMSAALTTSWPFISGGRVGPENGALTTGALSESGAIRGYLPDGTPVVTDANIPTNLGTGTNEDEVYVVNPEECHLWEDPNSPMMIRADQPQNKKLLVDLVLYGYYAFYLDRYAGGHSKLAGTGLVTPSF